VGENGIVGVRGEADLPFLGVFIEIDPRDAADEKTPKFVKWQGVCPKRSGGAVCGKGDGVH
jgi:hypothetical protein